MEPSFIDDIKYVLRVVQTRYRIILAFILLAFPVSYAVLKTAGTEYETTVMLNLQQETNSDPLRGGGARGYVREVNLSEKFLVLRTWLTSDHVLSGYLDEINAGKAPLSPVQKAGRMIGLRNSIGVEPLGSSAFSVTLKDANPKGLGHKLEVLIIHFLEGFARPNEEMVGTSQFLRERYRQRMEIAAQDLVATLKKAGFENVAAMREKLTQLNELEERLGDPMATAGMGGQEDVDTLRQSIQAVTDAIKKLASEGSFDEEALNVLQIKDRYLTRAKNDYQNFGRLYAEEEKPNFLDLERLTMVGRPLDPVLGQSKGKKYAVLAFLVHIALAGGVVVLLELLEQRLYRPEDFVRLSSVPVIAHLSPETQRDGMQVPPRVQELWMKVWQPLAKYLN